jgi:hypothetical protein
VTIRQIGEQKVDVVPAERFPRRKTLADYGGPTIRFEPVLPWELLDEQALLALSPGAPIAIEDDPERLPWFVRDINGPERMITAATVMFDQPRQRTVSFDLVRLVELAAEDEADAARAIGIIDQRFGRVPRSWMSA